MGLARVLVVEDDAFSRTLIVSTLEAGNFDVIAVADAKSAMGSLEDFEPNVALLDIDLGIGPTGIDVAYALRDKKSNLGIVFLTSFNDHRLSKASLLELPMGSRYITKGLLNQPAKLTSALLSAALKPLAVEKASRFRLPLNNHQIQIMRMVAGGLTNAEIARQLEISEKAVEHVIARVLSKLGIARTEKLNPRVQLVQVYAELSGKPGPR
jgi:DNA-binding NarL/FixJ family response regulator